MTSLQPTVENIRNAAKQIDGHALHTPLVESSRLNTCLNGRVLFKAECLQKTGSFKFRGAAYNIACLTEAEKRRGVVAFSSGNHAQGVARAAALLGVKSTVIMPADAPDIKINNTRAYGAEVILYDRYSENRETIGQAFAKKTGAVLIKPYDAVRTIAGQGTVGLEIAAQCRELACTPDYLLAPCGGGGLMAGLCLAASETMPGTSLYAVEPEAYDDTRRSFESGQIETNESCGPALCDAIITPCPGDMTFAINRKHLTGVLSVSDAEVAAAVQAAFLHLKLVVEPGGVVGLAALLAGKLDLAGRSAVIVLSGGNVDARTFQMLLEGRLPA